MLEREQLDLILNKEKPTIEDIILLHDHLDYIEKIQNEYEENIPLDVGLSFKNDLERIIVKMQSMLKQMKKDKLKVIVGENNVW